VLDRRAVFHTSDVIVSTTFIFRNTSSLYQQNAGLKKSVEEKLGLPLKPKKPLTPYFRFMAQIRPVLIQKNPQAKVTGRSSFRVLEMKILQCFVLL